MNRAERRRIDALRRQSGKSDASTTLDCGILVNMVAALIEGDTDISGVTVIAPDGSVDYLNAATLRQGGSA